MCSRLTKKQEIFIEEVTWKKRQRLLEEPSDMKQHSEEIIKLYTRSEARSDDL